MTIHHQVLHILAEDPESRNDDNRLVCVLWKTYHPEMCVEDKVSMKDIVLNLPKAETIGRSRRIIQNTLGLFVPTKESVAKGRKMAQAEWEEAMRHTFNATQAKAILDVFLEAKGKTVSEVGELVERIKKQLK